MSTNTANSKNGLPLEVNAGPGAVAALGVHENLEPGLVRVDVPLQSTDAGDVAVRIVAQPILIVAKDVVTQSGNSERVQAVTGVGEQATDLALKGNRPIGSVPWTNLHRRHGGTAVQELFQAIAVSFVVA